MGQWGWQEEMLRNILYTNEVIIWQNSGWKNKAEAKKNKPTIFTPPFMPKPKKPKAKVSMNIDELKDYLNKPRS